MTNKTLQMLFRVMAFFMMGFSSASQAQECLEAACRRAEGSINQFVAKPYERDAELIAQRARFMRDLEVIDTMIEQSGKSKKSVDLRNAVVLKAYVAKQVSNEYLDEQFRLLNEGDGCIFGYPTDDAYTRQILKKFPVTLCEPDSSEHNYQLSETLIKYLREMYDAHQAIKYLYPSDNGIIVRQREFRTPEAGYEAFERYYAEKEKIIEVAYNFIEQLSESYPLTGAEGKRIYNQYLNRIREGIVVSNCDRSGDMINLCKNDHSIGTLKNIGRTFD